MFWIASYSSLPKFCFSLLWVLPQNFTVSPIIMNKKSFDFECQFLINSWSWLLFVGLSKSSNVLGIYLFSTQRVQNSRCETYLSRLSFSQLNFSASLSVCWFLLLVLGGRWFGLVVIGSSVIVQAYALLTNRVRIVSSISFLALLFDFGRFCRFISSQH